jgi:preprotein translocase subunit SecY
MAEDRNPAVALPMLILTIVLIALYYWSTRAVDPLAFTLFVLSILGLMGFVYLIVSYSGDKDSRLYGLKPLIDKMPAVKRPEGHVHFRTKMMWTLGILVFYFVMTNVMMYGLEQSIDIFSEFRAIMAGANGSLMHLGIGPIVTGSIIMQLFTGAKIIKLDLTNEEDKAIYQGTQKVVVIIMIIVESVPQVYGYLIPHASFVDSVGGSTARMIIVLQLIIGSYLVFLMDEVISKWGIGSGISLFIAAGVSEAIFTGTVNWMPTQASEQIYPGSPSGTFPKTVYLLQQMSLGEVAGGGWEAIFIREPNPILALIGTIVIFLVVAFVESSRIELPLAHGRVRGARGRYPIRLIYASNIPVILMAALLANINMFSLLLWNHPSLSKIPMIGHKWWIGAFRPGETQPYMGGAWYLSRPNGVSDWLLPLLNWERYGAFVTGSSG